MLRIQGTTFVPIAQAEDLIAQNQALNTFNNRIEEAIRVVADLRSKGFDLSVEKVFNQGVAAMRSWGNPHSVEEEIKSTRGSNQLLDDLKRKIACAALDQLGAIYWVRARGRLTKYNSVRYDSPTLGSGIEVIGDLGFFTEFDPDVAFKDIPLLIEKSQTLARTLKEKGLVIN